MISEEEGLKVCRTTGEECREKKTKEERIKDGPRRNEVKAYRAGRWMRRNRVTLEGMLSEVRTREVKDEEEQRWGARKAKECKKQVHGGGI